MRTRARRSLIPVVLLSLFGPAVATTDADCGPERLTIAEGDLVSGSTAGMPLSCALEEIARRTGAEIQGTVDDGVVQFDLKQMPLAAALARLLGDRSYLLLLREGRLVRISLLGDHRLVTRTTNAGANGARTTPPPTAADDAALAELRSILLEDPHVGERKAALERLQALPHVPTDLLAKVARQDFDPAMRRQALFVIGALGELDAEGRAAAEILQRNDPDKNVREAAAEVLRKQARRGGMRAVQ